jgi:hypothetical protein
MRPTEWDERMRLLVHTRRSALVLRREIVVPSLARVKKSRIGDPLSMSLKENL